LAVESTPHARHLVAFVLERIANFTFLCATEKPVEFGERVLSLFPTAYAEMIDLVVTAVVIGIVDL
jgi:hypothetical protein